jgi:hypothetical protein
MNDLLGVNRTNRSLGSLEDPSGNRVGRAFEVEMFERGDRMPQQERVTVPFKIR